MDKVKLYRGINEEEYNIWHNDRDLLNNVSWWTANKENACRRANFAIIEALIILDKEKEGKYENGALFERTLDYEGYGIRNSEYSLDFSFNKDYLFDNLISIFFVEIKLEKT